MTEFTQADKRDKIRSQLLYELGLPEIPKKQADKLPLSLSKKRKFLENKNKSKQPGEKPL